MKSRFLALASIFAAVGLSSAPAYAQTASGNAEPAAPAKAQTNGGPVTLTLPDAPSFLTSKDDAPPGDPAGNGHRKGNGGKGEKGEKGDKNGKDDKTAKAANGPILTQSDRRKAPDYDGRGSYTDAGDVLLWIPRVLVSPLYFVSEFIIRRPLGALVTAAENSNLPSELYDFFAFGPDHKAGIAPTILFDFGFHPSVGVYAFWDDAFVKGNDLRGHFSTWGTDWLAGQLADRIHLSKRKEDLFTLQLTGVTRPDKTFFGLGPNSLQQNRSRYGISTLDGGGVLDWRLWRSSSVHAAVGSQSVNFHSGGYPGDPTLDSQIRTGVFQTPPGYPNGYTEVYSRLAVALDTRRGVGFDGSGFRLELDGENDSDVTSSPGSGWVKYGGSAGGFYDLGRQRVVSLSGTLQFVDPLAHAEVPFTELVTLGGYGPMKGFYPGRLADRSAAVGELAYTWPIWMYLNGITRFEVGNVFGAHLQGIDAGLLRMSGALGIQAVGSPDAALELLIGAGSETFEHGAQIDSFRLYVGTSRGF